MLPLRFRRRWQLANGVLLLCVLVAALAPLAWYWPDRARLGSWFDGSDKWLHGITFALLALWFAGQFRRSGLWRIAVGLLAFGVFIELCQRGVGYRSAEWLDVAADAAGIAAGLAIAALGAVGWSLRFEHWLAGARQTG